MNIGRKSIGTQVQYEEGTRETPLPIYVGLKLYATVRSKTLIDRLFNLGICVSYERCLEICNDMAISLLEKYNQNKVFIASTLKLKLFTIIAKDNIDLIASSTKIKQHFQYDNHAISSSNKPRNYPGNLIQL